MRIFLSLVLLVSIQSSFAQIETDNSSSVLFWTAQDWECEFMKIQLFTWDSTLVKEGKLKDKYTLNKVPDCSESKVLVFTEVNPDKYFFVADCTKEECYQCQGEGSYWQPTIQDKTSTSSKTKTKGSMEGSWRTCYVCGGNGSASSILWLDTLSLSEHQCRSVLLK